MLVHLSNLFLNAIQKLDPQVLDPLTPYIGQRLCIQINDLNTLLCFEVKADKLLAIPLESKDSPHTTLSGNASDFIRLGMHQMLNPKAPIHLSQFKISISGDTALAQAFSETFQYFEIDWGHCLETFLGRGTAEWLSPPLSQMKNTMTDALETHRQNWVEYLQEEARLYPGEEECQDFYQDVAELRNDAERLFAKYQLYLRHKQP